MPFAIEMFFDSGAESRLRALWNDIAAFGAAPMPESARPHISLAVCDSLDPSNARALLDRFTPHWPPLAIALASVGVFPSSGVLFLAPKVTSQLLALHAAFFDKFQAMAVGFWEHYSPRHWVPHCTLAMNLAPEHLRSAHGVCAAFGLPLNCTLCEIGLVEFRPVRQLYAVPFAKAEIPA